MIFKNWTHKIILSIVFLFTFAIQAESGTLRTLNLQVSSTGENRNFLVYEPTGFNRGVPTPVLYMFHGRGGTAQGAASTTYDWQSTADQNQFLVVYPQALHRTDPFWDQFDPAGVKWHIIPGSPSSSKDVKFVQSIQQWLKTQYTVDTKRVYSTGHSFGAVFSHYVATGLTDFAAFAEHSGGLVYYPFRMGSFTLNIAVPLEPAQFRKIPGFLIHSTDDAVVPYSWSQTLQNALFRKGARHDFRTLTGKGHSWDKTLNQAQWEFFLANAKI